MHDTSHCGRTREPTSHLWPTLRNAVRASRTAAVDSHWAAQALEKALLAFHTTKMADINKIIKEMWQKTYRNQDIDHIQARVLAPSAQLRRCTRAPEACRASGPRGVEFCRQGTRGAKAGLLVRAGATMDVRRGSRHGESTLVLLLMCGAAHALRAR